MSRRALPLGLVLVFASTWLFADPASDLLVSGRKAFADAQYALAARTLRRVVEEFPESAKAEEAAYLLGVAQFYTGSYAESAAALAGLRSRAPRSAFAARAGYWLGAATLRLGRHEKALEILRAEASRTDADAVYKPHAMLLAGTALEELGRDAEAAAQYRALLAVPRAGGADDTLNSLSAEALNSLRAEALYRLAGTDYRAGRWESARDGYARVLLEYARSPLVRDAVFFVGECERALGDLAGAEKRYRSLLSLYADSPWREAATLRLAEIAARAGKPAEALEQVNAALARSGASALQPRTRGDALRLRGDILYDQKRFEEALASYSRASEVLEEGAERQALHYALGLAQLALARKADAAGSLDAARAGPAADIAEKASFQLAALHAGSGSHAEAARVLETQIADRPRSTRTEEALRLLSAALESDGQAAAAVARYDLLVRDFPRSQLAPEYLYRRGLALMKLGRQAAALEDFQRVAKDFPRSPLKGECSYSVGYLYSQRGEHARAVPFFKAALEGSPSAALAERASLAMGISWFNTGAYEKALSSLDALRRRPPKTVSVGLVLLHMGRTLYRMERLAEAASRLGEAMAVLPKDADGSQAAYWLGWSLFRLNRLEEARDAYLLLASEYPGQLQKSEGFFRAGMCESTRGNDAAAVALFDRALAIPRGEPGVDIREQALYERGWSLSRLGRPAESADAFELLAREFPSGKLAPEAFFRRAAQALEQKRHSDAREGFLRIAREFPSSQVADQALFWAAESSLEGGDLKRAAEGFWAYLSSRPRGSMTEPAQEGFARALAAEGSPSLAADFAARAQAAKGLPVETLVRVRLAHARLLLPASPKEAGEIAAELRRRTPGEPLAGEVNLLLGQSLAAAGETRRALEIFTVLAGSRADRVGAEAKREQAMALEAAGNTSEAVDEYMRISYLFPDFPDLAAEGLFNAARVTLRRGEKDRARTIEDSLRRSFPESPWTAKLQELR